METKILFVDQVSLHFGFSNPPVMILGASGRVPTSGWSNGVLVPRVYITPPQDGIWDFDFIATAPEPNQLVLQKITEITSKAFVSHLPKWFLGARVHSSTNSLTNDDNSSSEQSGLKVTTSGSADNFPWVLPQGPIDGFPWLIADLAEASPRNQSQKLSDELAKELIGNSVRVYHEGDAVTKDYRKDRFNVILSKENDTIVSVYFG
ncbi:MAG: hypothetical protein RLZZ352_1087 [Pseudomonadota bacterium]|jgi:hypothetical protein